MTYDDLANADLISVCARRKGLPVALGVLFLTAGKANGLAISETGKGPNPVSRARTSSNTAASSVGTSSKPGKGCKAGTGDAPG